MNRIILAFVLVAGSAFGQAFTFLDMAWMGKIATPVQSGGGSGFTTITNVPGYPTLAWYRSDFVTTNGGNNYTWVNLMGNTLYDLTNKGAASSWPTRVSADLNGFDALNFATAASQYVNSQGLTATQPTEYFMVCKWNVAATPGGVCCYIDGNNGGRNTVYYDNAGDFGYFSGSSLVKKPSGNNYYFIWDAAFNGIASVILTNNVIVATNTTSPGANNLNGLYVARDFTGGGQVPLRVIDFIIYSTNLSAVMRSNVWFNLKTRYGL